MTPADQFFNWKISINREDFSNLTEATQKEEWRKICGLCCLLQKPYMERPKKERPVIKGKNNYNRKNGTLCCACGHCFDLFLCRTIGFFSKRLVRKNKCIFTPAPILYACRYSFAMLTHVCNVLSRHFRSKGQAWVLLLIRAINWDTSRDV